PLTRAQFLPDTRAIGNGVIVNQGNWQAQLEANKVAFFADFVSRSRFASQYPSNLTAQQFVDALYANAGVTPASAQNRAAAMNEVNAAPADNAARARALRLIAEDPMLVRQELHSTVVVMDSFDSVQSTPEQSQ